MIYGRVDNACSNYNDVISDDEYGSENDDDENGSIYTRT